MERRWYGCRSRKSVQAKSLVFFGDIFDASVNCGAVLCLDRRTSERQSLRGNGTKMTKVVAEYFKAAYELEIVLN